eukprot:s2851_g13.t2
MRCHSISVSRADLSRDKQRSFDSAESSMAGVKSATLQRPTPVGNHTLNQKNRNRKPLVMPDASHGGGDEGSAVAGWWSPPESIARLPSKLRERVVQRGTLKEEDVKEKVAMSALQGSASSSPAAPANIAGAVVKAAEPAPQTAPVMPPCAAASLALTHFGVQAGMPCGCGASSLAAGCGGCPGCGPMPGACPTMHGGCPMGGCGCGVPVQPCLVDAPWAAAAVGVALAAVPVQPCLVDAPWAAADVSAHVQEQTEGKTPSHIRICGQANIEIVHPRRSLKRRMFSGCGVALGHVTGASQPEAVSDSHLSVCPRAVFSKEGATAGATWTRLFAALDE